MASRAVSDNCPIREGRGLLLVVVCRDVPTLLKRAGQKKKDWRKQYSGRRRQMQVGMLIPVFLANWFSVVENRF